MERVGADLGNWTVARVERRLIAAFRALPSFPIFSVDGQLRGVRGDPEGHAAALNWTRTFVLDEFSVRALMIWARCRATGESIRERYRLLKWNRSGAEKARRRALSRIVQGLNQRELDRWTNPPGAFGTVAESRRPRPAR